MSNNKLINISAAIIINNRDEILLVRKNNSMYFMQAGGKIEIGETPIQALIREIHEELGLTLAASKFAYLGQFCVAAANEANHNIDTHLFAITIDNTELTAQAELAEVGWFTIDQAKKLTLAPLTEHIILPILENLNSKNNKPAI